MLANYFFYNGFGQWFDYIIYSHFVGTDLPSSVCTKCLGLHTWLAAQICNLTSVLIYMTAMSVKTLKHKKDKQMQL